MAVKDNYGDRFNHFDAINEIYHFLMPCVSSASNINVKKEVLPSPGTVT